MNRPPCYLTADSILIFENEVLLIQRGRDPFQGKWALPGGFVDEGEKVLDAAKRELEEETGISGQNLVQFGAYGDPGRDPRGRVVSIAHWVLLEAKPEATAGDDAAEYGWFDLDHLPDLAFDHARILFDVRERLRSRH
jgi:8-oxo-dGTP diphosphatase